MTKSGGFAEAVVSEESEIEVTPEMIEVGLAILVHYNPRETSEAEDNETLTEIFRAMYRLRAVTVEE